MTPSRIALLGSMALLAAMQAACSTTPEPLGQAAVMDTAAPTSEPTSAAASESATPRGPDGPRASGPGGPVTAKLVEVEPSTDGSKDLHASITFDNPGPGDCKVSAYTLTWPGGTKTVKVDGFSVRGGVTAKRSMRMHPEDGTLDTLKVADGAVTTKHECP